VYDKLHRGQVRKLVFPIFRCICVSLGFDAFVLVVAFPFRVEVYFRVVLVMDLAVLLPKVPVFGMFRVTLGDLVVALFTSGV
jgi:hypothetical protein